MADAPTMVRRTLKCGNKACARCWVKFFVVPKPVGNPYRCPYCGADGKELGT